MTPAPMTYRISTAANGDVTMTLRSFTHERGCGNLLVQAEGVDIYSGGPSPLFTSDVLFVQGTDPLCDSDPIRIPLADWPRVLASLTEYGAVDVTEAATCKQSLQVDPLPRHMQPAATMTIREATALAIFCSHVVSSDWGAADKDVTTVDKTVGNMLGTPAEAQP